MAFNFGSPSGITYSGAGAGLYDRSCTAGTASVAGVLPSATTWTVEIAVKVTPIGTAVALQDSNAFWIGTLDGNNAFAQYGTGGGAVNMSTSVFIADGAWHRLRLSVSSTGAVLLVDGAVAATSSTTPAAAGVSTGGTWFLRSLGGGYSWGGEVDEVACWNVSLPSAYTPAAVSDTAANLVAVWHLDNNLNDSKTTVAATGVTLSGPSTGLVSVASTNFTVGVTPTGGTITGTVTVTPADGGGGGTFTPTSVGLTTASPTATFTYTPASVGAKTISATNNGGLTNPSNLTYTATSAAATAITMTGPSSGSVGAASSNFTVGANGTITGTVIVTPADGGGGGTFTPTTVSISSGSPTGTFTYTAASVGAKTISATNNGGLTNPSSITYTAAAPALYTRVDATDGFSGEGIMVLVPAGGSSNPYNSANPTGVILYTHGLGESESALLDDSLKTACVNALLDAGYILAGSNAHGGWPGPQAADDYAALDKYVRDNYNVKGVCIWSQSLGGMAGLLAIAQGRIHAIGWLGTYPLCSLNAAYNGIGGSNFAYGLDGPFGITGTGLATYASRTRGWDPGLMRAAEFKHAPMRFYASAGDGTVGKTQNTDVIKAIVDGWCRESTVVVCTGGHGDPSHFVPAEYVAFFGRCFATPVATARPAATRAVTVTLQTLGLPAASLTGLKWAWWDQITPDLAEYPTDQGAVETTDGSGVLSITVHTALGSGGVGWLTVTNSDGTTTQSPAHKAYSGPVAVS